MNVFFYLFLKKYRKANNHMFWRRKKNEHKFQENFSKRMCAARNMYVCVVKSVKKLVQKNPWLNRNFFNKEKKVYRWTLICISKTSYTSS